MQSVPESLDAAPGKVCSSVSSQSPSVADHAGPGGTPSQVVSIPSSKITAVKVVVSQLVSTIGSITKSMASPTSTSSVKPYGVDEPGMLRYSHTRMPLRNTCTWAPSPHVVSSSRKVPLIVTSPLWKLFQRRTACSKLLIPGCPWPLARYGVWNGSSPYHSPVWTLGSCSKPAQPSTAV